MPTKMKNNSDNTPIPESCLASVSGSVTARDLRIGNLVMRYDLVYEVWSLKTKELELDSKVLDRHINYCTYDEISLIPITEEWLNRFDFSKWDNEYSLSNEFFYISFKFYKNGNIKLWINNESKKYMKGEVMTINYINQLQNLYFTLTGSELQLADLTDR